MKYRNYEDVCHKIANKMRHLGDGALEVGAYLTLIGADEKWTQKYNGRAGAGKKNDRN